MEEMMDVAGNEAMLRRLNERGGGMLFYLDNETPKSCFGHMWYVGFKQTVPAWHDYSQDRPCWYSDYDNDTAERNALTGDYHKRRTYATIVAEQRRYGALAIWAHPTSWWTKDGKNKGPFVTKPRARVLRARPVADPRHRGEGHDALQLDSVPAPSVHD